MRKPVVAGIAAILILLVGLFAYAQVTRAKRIAQQSDPAFVCARATTCCLSYQKARGMYAEETKALCSYIQPLATSKNGARLCEGERVKIRNRIAGEKFIVEDCADPPKD